LGLEKVLLDIKKKGSEEAQAIVAEGKNERKRILDETRSSFEKLHIERSEALKSKIEQLWVQETSVAALEAKKKVLLAKQDQLDELYKLVIERLADLPKKENESLLKELLSKASEGFDIGVIHCNERDVSFIEKNLKGTGLKVGSTLDCVGGMTVEDPTGSISIDYRYESLLEQMWKDKMKQISDMLFEGK